MNSIKAYKLLLTPLSPVHIGTGESYEPTNYVIEDGVLHEFDTGAVTQIMTSVDRDKLLSITNSKPSAEMIESLQRFFFERRKPLMGQALQRIPVLSGVAGLYDKRIGKTANVESDGKKVINRLEIDRTGFHPITRLPILYGSSLKGAIRTALLDRINNGAPLQKVTDPRTYREREENNLQLQQRLFQFRAGKFELDPMRLVQLGDAAWAGEAGLPAAEVYLAVNRKKAPVKDEQGRLRKSLAESKDLYQILECVPAWRYRTFTSQINLQSIVGLDEKQQNKLPADNLRFHINDIAGACNAYYTPILESEANLLRERGYIDDTWDKAVQKLLGAAAKAMQRGEAFLLRVGRHSGAESVTLNGVRNIKINRGKDQQPEWRRETKTLWLAADEIDQATGLLPFGWLLVEVVPFASEVADWSELKELCEPHLIQARAFSKGIAEQQVAFEQARIEADAKKRAEEDRRAAEEARLRQIEEERKRKDEAEKGRLAALSPLEQSMEEVLKADTDPGKKDAVKLLEALKKGRWMEDEAHHVAQRIKADMQLRNLWKETSAKKNPAKDHDYQRTLEVMKFLKAGAD
jgi:CRISPR-associated protein Csm5